jgi:hypothetical protein
MTDTLKASILAALRKFIRQRPGLELCNYGDASSYRSEARGIARDRRDAETLLAAVEACESLTGAMLLEAFPRAFSGRLKCEVLRPAQDGDACEVRVRLSYCTGQYFPTEYRKAAAAVLASALWDWTRERGMPTANSWRVESWGKWDGSQFVRERSKPMQIHAATEYLAEKGGQEYGHVQDYINGKTPGDWLRSYFRDRFGRHLAARWFN